MTISYIVFPRRLLTTQGSPVLAGGAPAGEADVGISHLKHIIMFWLFYFICHFSCFFSTDKVSTIAVNIGCRLYSRPESVNKNTPLEKTARGKISFQSPKSGCDERLGWLRATDGSVIRRFRNPGIEISLVQCVTKGDPKRASD